MEIAHKQMIEYFDYNLTGRNVLWMREEED